MREDGLGWAVRSSPGGPHVAVAWLLDASSRLRSAGHRSHDISQGAKSGAIVGAMDLSKDIEPVTALKRSAADLITRATDRHSPIVITQNGKPTAVLQDVHSYERQQRALHLLKLLAQGEQDLRAGRVHDQESVDGLVATRLSERRGAS